MNKEFEYGDEFKEDLIDQLCFLVEEMKQINLNLTVIKDELSGIAREVHYNN